MSRPAPQTPRLVHGHPAAGAPGRGAARVHSAPSPLHARYATVTRPSQAGPVGAIIAWLGLFLPGLLLIYAALPYWGEVRNSPQAASLLRGVNAAASGLVVAAALLLLDHVRTPPQHAIALVAFALHHFVGPALLGPKLNPPLTILFGALLGVVICLPWLLYRCAVKVA